MIHVLSVNYLLTLCFHQTFFSLKFNLEPVRSFAEQSMERKLLDLN